MTEVALDVALILETNNLKGGGASRERACDSLVRLMRHLRAQTRPLRALAELVVTHDGLEPGQRARVEEAAGRAITFVRLPEGTGYYDAKNLGFDATRSPVVAFGDADCWPEPSWLEHLLAPLEEAEPGAPALVAGRTTYRGDLLGVAATAIDFMYFPSPLGPGCTRNFYANNLAVRREAFAACRYGRMDGTYRGHCQALGLELQRRGVRIRFEPRARTVHRFPDSARELIKLRWLRGQDAVELTPHLADAYLPPPLRPIGRRAAAPLAVLGVRLGLSVRAVGRQDMPPLAGARYLACLGVVGGLSMLDAAGALWGSARRAAGRRRRRAPGEALSYHGNRDGLAA